MSEDLAWRVWYRQYNALHGALAPWVVTDGDWQGVSPDAPAELREPYSSLQSVGYAKGWL
jgi:hypothetical protein